MTNATHTPGPWTVEPEQVSHGCALAIIAGGIVVARTPEVSRHNSKMQRTIDVPNARLMAAAPDLLEALRGLLDTMETPRTRKATTAWTAARAAISKATGGA